MSTMYRILGIEFTPARLDATHPLSKGKTGFEIGRDSFYKNGKVPPTFASMIRAMGISEDSEAEYDMKDLLRIGDSETIDFVQDFITGWSHSSDLKNKANKTLGCFSYAVEYLCSRSQTIEFFRDDLLSALGESDLRLVDSENRDSNLRDAIESNEVHIVKERNIFFGGTQGFKIHPDLVYTDEVCRTLTKFFGKINDSLYVAIALIMQEEHFESKVRQIREHVIAGSDFRLTEPSEMPNFFDKK